MFLSKFPKVDALVLYSIELSSRINLTLNSGFLPNWGSFNKTKPLNMLWRGIFLIEWLRKLMSIGFLNCILMPIFL
jgi:hypothetical protein